MFGKQKWLEKNYDNFQQSCLQQWSWSLYKHKTNGVQRQKKGVLSSKVIKLTEML